MKQIIRLTESDLHRIVRESIQKILREDGEAGAMGDGGGMTLNFGGGNSYEPGGSTTTTTVPREREGDQTFGMAYPMKSKKKDPSLGREDVINFGEKPVGHKG